MENAFRDLAASEVRFRGTLDGMLEGCQILDRDWKYLYLNNAAAAHGRRRKEELLGRTMMESFPGIDQAPIFARLRRTMEERVIQRIENRFIYPDGSDAWFELSVQPAAEGLFILSLDITQRKQAELRAAAQHALTVLLSEAAPLQEIGRRMLEVVCRDLDWDLGEMWQVDTARSALRCTDTWHAPDAALEKFAAATRATALGAGEGLPGVVWRNANGEWVENLAASPSFSRAALAAGLGLKLETGVVVPVRLRKEIFGVIAFMSRKPRPPDPDLLALLVGMGAQIGQFIERQRLEEQFRQAQKMEAIGTLAGGIAHDFNNVLSAINGYAELAVLEIPDRPVALDFLKSVMAGSARAKDLVRQILAFSRLQEQQRKPIQLKPILEEALRLLRATIPSSIAFDVFFASDLPAVVADPTQIHQLLMNLATNAAHAMRDKGGTLGVTLEAIEVDADFAALHAGLQPRAYVRLGVTDTGHGMDAATLARIYDPFFTTKGQGEGTGLGLAVVHGIMQRHDGVISVYSEPGIGTRFHLYFPAAVEPAAEPAGPAAELERGAGENILLVDDEEILASLGKALLGRLGYTADAVTSPGEAIGAVTAEPAKYRAVVTDMTMPGMSGTELAQALWKVRPNLPVILTTGYNPTLKPDTVRALGISALIFKPYGVRELASALARACGAARPPAPG